MLIRRVRIPFYAGSDRKTVHVATLSAWALILIGVYLGYKTGKTIGYFNGDGSVMMFFGAIIGGGIGFVLSALIIPPIIILFAIYERMEIISDCDAVKKYRWNGQSASSARSEPAPDIGEVPGSTLKWNRDEEN
jgi:hypothetical protein